MKPVRVVRTRNGSTYEFNREETHVRKNSGEWRELRNKPTISSGFPMFLSFASGGIWLTTHIIDMEHAAVMS